MMTAARPDSLLVDPHHLDLERAPAHAAMDPTLSTRERREAAAAETAAQEMTKRKRWNMTTWSKTVELWKDLDVLGLVALTVGCILFLLPFTLATKRPESWGDCAFLTFRPPRTHSQERSHVLTRKRRAAFIWMLILSGAAILVFFGYHERHAAVPLIPPRLLKNRTILSGSAIGFFHFCSQFCYESFFTSFLQCVPLAHGGRLREDLIWLTCAHWSTGSHEVIRLKTRPTSGELSPSQKVYLL